MKFFNGLVAKVFVTLTIAVSSVMGVFALNEVLVTSNKLEKNWHVLHEVNILNLVPSQGIALWGMYKQNARRGLQAAFQYGEVQKIAVYDDLGRPFAGLEKTKEGQISSYEAIQLDENIRKELLAKLGDIELASEKNLLETEVARSGAKTVYDTDTGVTRLFLPVLTLQLENLKHVGFIVAEYTSNEVQSQIGAQNRHVLLLTLGLIGALLSLSFLLLQVLIIRPISRIAKASLEVADGNFVKVEKIVSNDEIGTLAQNFNHMIDEIEDRTKNLKTLVAQGEAIASQFDLKEISRQIEFSILKLVPFVKEVKVFFSQACFLSDDLSQGYYSATVDLSAGANKVVPVPQLELEDGLKIYVDDPRGKEKLAIIQIFGADEGLDQKTRDSLHMISVHVGSALSSARLGQAFIQLDSRTLALRSIFSNIDQGIFIVDDNFIIGSEYSLCLEKMLGRGSLAGLNFKTEVLNFSNLTNSSVSLIESVLRMMVGSDKVFFDSQSLPSEFVYKFSQSEEKIFEVDWKAMTGSDGETIKNYMITLRDVTQLRKLQLESQSNREDVEILIQIVNLTQEQFFSFVEPALTNMRHVLSLLNEEALEDACLKEVSRILHTVKGNARIFGFKLLAELVHDEETRFNSTVEEMKSTDEPNLLLSKLAQGPQKINALIEKYAKVAREKVFVGAEHTAKRVAIVKRLVEEVQESFDFGKQHESIFQTVSRLASLELPSVSKLVSEQKNWLESLSGEGCSYSYSLEFETVHDWVISSESFDALRTVFSHLCANSVDHGFQGCSGSILIGATELQNGIKLNYRDSGKGLNLERIKAKGQQSGCINGSELCDDNKIAELIFESGLSTSQTVTMTSGRGVGMDAVRDILEKVGGKIHIEFTGPKCREGYRRFQFVIELPKKCVELTLSSHGQKFDDVNPPAPLAQSA